MIRKVKKITFFQVATFFAILFFALDVYYLADSIEDLTEPVTIHGPHVGTDLTKYVESKNELDLAAIIKSGFRRASNNARPSSSKPTPLVSPTSLPTPTAAPTSIPKTVTQAASVTLVKDNGFGVAAGGGLTSLNQQELNKYFTALKDLGVSWIRWDIDWATVQPNNINSYNWDRIDMVAYTARNFGIRSLAIITYAPDWAEIDGCPLNKICPPRNISDFANFTEQVAKRYKGTIEAYEIWNEQNFQLFWYPSPNFSVYSDMLKQSYTKIKNVDSSVLVISGGLAAAEDSSNGSISPKSFVNGLYSSGAKNYFDALALHPYSYPVAPDYSATWNSFQQMFEIRNIMIKNGDTSKNIWITEYGAPTGGPGFEKRVNQLAFTYGKDYMSEDSQGALAKTASEIYTLNKSWIGKFFWYSLRDNGTSNNDPENFFGLIRNDWSKKPSFEHIHSIISTQ